MNELLIEVRKAHGFTQEKLAEILGVATSTVARWERGEVSPFRTSMQLLCAYFKMSEAELGFSAVSPQPPSGGIPLEIPAITSTLVGRDRDLATLCHKLIVGSHVAVTGLPGVGKTTLAAALARHQEIQEHFDGVLWAGLGRSPNLLDLLSHWGTLLKMNPQKMASLHTMAQWKTALREAIGTCRFLLVIDDAWKIEEAEAFLLGGPQCIYLVTTRVTQVAIEVADNNVLVLRELSEADGMHLLHLLAPQVVETEPQKAQRLVQATGGLPLALTLMGQSLLKETYAGQPRRIQAALERLDDTQARLQVAGRTSGGRSARLAKATSLQAIIAISDQFISDQASVVLAALAVFAPKPASFSEAAACAVAACTVEVLDELVDACLVEYVGPNRYLLHQTIADYARKKLAASASCAPYERLIAYALTYLEEQKCEALALESPMLFAALDAAVSLDKEAELIHATLLFAPCMLARGWFAPAEWYLQQTYQAAREQEPALISILFSLGQTFQKQGRYPEAISSWQEGLDLARRLDEKASLCALLLSTCRLQFLQGDHAPLASSLDAGLYLAREAKCQEQICGFLNLKGMLALSLGNYTQAEGYFLQGMHLLQSMPAAQQRLLGMFYLGLAGSPARRGNYAQAEDYYQKGWEAAERSDDKQTASMILAFRSHMRTFHMPSESLRDDFQQALKLTREANHLGYGLIVYKFWGLLEVVLGNLEGADQLTQQGLHYATQIGAFNARGELLTNLAQIETECGKYVQADADLTEAQTLVRQYSNTEEQSRTLMVRADLALKQGQFDVAEIALRDLGEVIPAEHAELQGLMSYGLARLAAARGKKREARSHAETSLHFFKAMRHYKTQEVHDWLLSHVDPLRWIWLHIQQAASSRRGAPVGRRSEKSAPLDNDLARTG